MRKMLEEFKVRGILKDISNELKIENAIKEQAGIYIGFDPTADSLHVGHLVQILLLKRFSIFGLKPIVVLGGGTGRIGDPSFKKDERPLLSDEIIQKNINNISKQFKKILPNTTIVNNGQWLNKLSLTDFLRDIGKRFTLSYLLAKESIATRIEKGLSITEFFYNLLQAYDFYMLYKDYNCMLQCGGSDQWGNIISGMDLISSFYGKDNSKAACLTTNLLTKKNGQKFGKTEDGAIWLEENKTSNFEFYQFFLNQTDEDAYSQLKWLSFLSFEEIEKLKTKSQDNPKLRIMQKQLADELTTLVRGESGLEEAKKVSDSLFNNTINNLSEKELNKLTGIPTFNINEDYTIIDFLVKTTICTSNRDARLFIKDKSITINGNIINSDEIIINKNNCLYKKYLIIKKGKRNFYKVIYN